MSKKLYFNGVNGGTGGLLHQPLAPEEMLTRIVAADKNELKAAIETFRIARERRATAKAGVLGVVYGIEPTDVAEAGWGVIYHPETPAAARDALHDLVQLRHGRVLEYQPPETAQAFRKRHKQDVHGPVDPTKLPYYLLIVASPQQIPFVFQYSLDAEHAVGRLHFDDPVGYGRYVKSLIGYEQNPATAGNERRAVFFAPANPGDEATALSSLELAKPLATVLNKKPLKVPGHDKLAYVTEASLVGGTATKKALLDLLQRTNQRPALIFTAAHGLGFPKGHALQTSDQGAVVCQDWGNMAAGVPTAVSETCYLAGRHVPADVICQGQIFFSFSCYSAGTPALDDFAHLKQETPKELAAAPIISGLPQQLLARGALAFIGHVERAWGFSFLWQDAGPQLGVFQSTLESLLAGTPVGHAFEFFNDRCAALAREVTEADLKGKLHQWKLGEPIDPGELAELWIAHNDARAYVVLGDPAIRLKPLLLKQP